MKPTPATVRLGPLNLTPAAAGALCCVVAVLGYGTANICMRNLSAMDCVTTWAVCNKELVTVLVVGPWVLLRIWQGRLKFPTGRPLRILIASGLATQLIGNTAIQWGYGVVGLAIMIPANTAFVLTCSATLSGAILGERVTWRNLGAVGLLLAALALLGAGAMHANPEAVTLPQDPWLVAAAIAAACAAGIVFSLLGMAIRHCAVGEVPHSTIVVIVTGMGVLSLGPLSFCLHGAEKILATPPAHYGWTFAAGACNLVAFLALVRGLQLTTVLHVNMLNAGQIALAALAGVVFFRETCSAWLLAGVLLMIVGIIAFGSPANRDAVDTHV